MRHTTIRNTALAALLLGAGTQAHAQKAVKVLSCLVDPSVVIDASTSQEGILRSVDVHKGDVVKRSQVIATLVSDVEQGNVALAKVRAGAKAALQSRQARVDHALSKLKRIQGLNKKDFVSAEERDELRHEVQLAQLELNEEKERIELARIDLQRNQSLLEMRTVRSPIDGVVVERFLAPGEFAQAQRIVRLAQVDPLNIEVTLPASEFAKVKTGDPATVELAPPVGGRYAATVTVVDRIIDGASATFGVRLELANSDYALPAGIDCKVRFGTPAAGRDN